MVFRIVVAAALLSQGLAVYADDKEDLKKAAEKTGKVTNYAFKTSTDIEGFEGQTFTLEFDGKHDKDAGSLMAGSLPGGAGDIVIIRKGDRVVAQRDGGDWQSPEDFDDGGQGAHIAEFLKTFRLPHEDVKGADKFFKEIKKTADEKVGDTKATKYSGDLTDDGLTELNPLGRMLKNLGVEPEISGSGALFVDENGVIVKIEVKITAKIDLNGNEVELTLSRTSRLSGVDGTKVELPKEALEKLEKQGKKEEKKEDK